MSNTINFGIDLGTTNSVIAKYNQGKVEIFKNPVGHKETLPSVVAFRKERVFVGDKAREFLERDPENVVGSFKRKMGTSEVFAIRSTGEEKTPIELSAYVLKELKTFIHTGEQVDAAVITIPASFDTIQSNATKKAGYLAGFEEVYLLQEPIAASLAYANKEEDELKDGQWLVYDLGGGTFDVALVSIHEGEMKILDHQGDNFLGGLDFDNRVIERIIIPYLNQKGKFGQLEKEMKSASGKYNKLYFQLLKKSEDVKVNLSNKETAEIEFEIEDSAGEIHDIFFTISRKEFENAIEDKLSGTIEMMRMILDRNNLSSSDIRFVLMIGGSTYIPKVRDMVSGLLNIPVNCNIDPTAAVAVGAAYFAGTKNKSQKKPVPSANHPASGKPDFKIKTAFQKTSQEQEEYFTAKAEGNFKELYYRVTRQDGGYDSGLKELTERISESLPLVKDSYNYFSLKIYDKQNNLIADDTVIEIVHGKFNVLGQPLPNDICIEIDDYENNATKLEVIFEKNSILPLKRTITKSITKTIKKDSNDSVIINILEGTHFASPLTNNSIGTIQILGSQLSRDLVKGSDIEIVIEISESRDLRITTYLLMTDQEFTNLFSPSARHINISKLSNEIDELAGKVIREISEANAIEEYETSASLVRIQDEISLLNADVKKLSDDDVTDSKYQLEDKKRSLAAKIDELTKDKKMTKLKSEYFVLKKACTSIADQFGNADDKKQLNEIIFNEKQFLAYNSVLQLKSIIKKLEEFAFRLNWKRPEYVIEIFYWYKMPNRYTDENKAAQYIEAGEKALERQNYDELRVVIYNLYGLLPPGTKAPTIKGTGIG